mmetsp:Transcript_20892/g.37222  ORF Transcript_20892/g.37222 Transcript_20892/m.37222 type:complete len:493 (-) Transcript_20892:272-1750(-)|eukprot:CAMPEP_0197516736 /NCGR_PEP_ID=MMETSP1318-20131121/1644_1 /TAXON_ID=552666 /ORGANISM="Partenskyella glossopodia, Strain RCC365" /LENGTH=492 /DNA_ID=CAMNT_0043065699 /DNA_START=984 /DNA_END=2462 /DNA_ORIENTATION=+
MLSHTNKRILSNARGLFPRLFSTAGDYDCVVIGAGPGGYVAAVKAGQLGMKVACIDKRGPPGGTCLNVGCIPSKALLNASHHYHMANHDFKKYGIKVENLEMDVNQMMKAKTKAIKGLTQGIEKALFKKNKVDYLKGWGKITGPNEVSIDMNDGETQTIKAKNIIIATGSDSASIPGIEVDEKHICTSTGALEFDSIPEKMIVIGAGVIGLEMGSVWGRLGSEVTVVEFLDRITPGVDSEIAKQFQTILSRKQKLMNFKLGTKVVGAEVVGDKVQLKVAPAKGGDEEILEADKVLVSIGRVPYLDGLGLESVGIEMDGRVIKTNDHLQTNHPHIYAIGDCVKGAMLAHKAEEEGIAAVEHMAGLGGHVNYDAIPNVIYTHPELATVGKSEDELKAEGVEYNKGAFPFMANSRARTIDDADGMVKVLACKKTDRLLGVHMLGPSAGEMIHEAVVGMEYGASSEDLARTCHAHPTLSEAVKEACMATYDKPIHM